MHFSRTCSPVAQHADLQSDNETTRHNREKMIKLYAVRLKQFKNNIILRIYKYIIQNYNGHMRVRMFGYDRFY